MTAAMTRDKILDALGLETRRTTAEMVLPAVGLFAAGLLVGAGLGLLFAPKAGAELRTNISDKVSNLRHRNAATGTSAGVTGGVSDPIGGFGH